MRIKDKKTYLNLDVYLAINICQHFKVHDDAGRTQISMTIFWGEI